MVSGSAGGRLSLLAPCDDAVGLHHQGRERAVKEVDMENLFFIIIFYIL